MASNRQAPHTPETPWWGWLLVAVLILVLIVIGFAIWRLATGQ